MPTPKIFRAPRNGGEPRTSAATWLGLLSWLVATLLAVAAFVWGAVSSCAAK